MRLVLSLFLSLFISTTYTQIKSSKVDTSKTIIAKIHVFGNKKTQSEIILRELPFKIGDHIEKNQLKKKLESSKINLTNTSLFNFIDIKSVVVDSMFTDIVIEVTERWYIWPSPILKFAETNFNNWMQRGDLSRLNYGIKFMHHNFRGRRENLVFRAQFGYTWDFGIEYKIPYLDKSMKHGLKFYSNYLMSRELFYNSENNKRVFITNDITPVQRKFYIGTEYTYRGKLYAEHKASITYNNVQISDSIYEYNPNYLPKSNFNYLGLFYQFTYDKRDNKVYPLRGWYSKTNLTVNGFLGESLETNEVYAFEEFKQFFQLKNRWFFAYMFQGKYTLSTNLPYYFQKGFGYNVFPRGYEYFVVDGSHFGLVRTAIKYQLLKSRDIHFKFIKSDKFNKLHLSIFLNAFADLGYVYNNFNEELNSLSNTWLPSTGIGVDFVTYYDKIVRFEVALNKLLKPGFYIHFKQAI